MIRGVFFDLDGTLVDSLADIAAAMNRALAQWGLPGFSVEDYRYKVGNGSLMLSRRCLPEDRRGEAEALRQDYSREYLAACCVRTKPYEGIVPMLETLRARGLKLAVITNKPQEQAEQVMRLLPETLWDGLFGQQSRFPVKPEPDIFRFAAGQLGLAPEEVLYCGDSDVDIRFAHNAGAKGLGCVWGFRGREELAAAGADFLADSPARLAEIALEQMG